MARDKKGFMMYADQKELFDQLPDDKAGRLIKHIFSYVNDENPQTDDMIISIAFTPIKQQLKRDLAKWEDKRQQYRDAGLASAEARYLKKQQLYIIECFDNKERFLKIGITDDSVSRRYGDPDNKSKAMPYFYKFLAQYSYKKGEIKATELESNIFNMFDYYTPHIKFAGYMECKHISDYENIIKYIFDLLEDKSCLTVFNDVERRSTVKEKVNVNDKDKDKDKIEERQLAFKKEVESFSDKYSLNMLRAFYAYWSEPNKSKTKMRCEMEKTWGTDRRLITWNNREKK